MIVVEELRKQYKKGQEIGPISYTMTPGKIIALVGENGAGKSTFMKLLMGHITSDGGTIEGINIEKIHYMPDDLNFPSTLKVQEIINLLGKLKGVPLKVQQHYLEITGLLDKQTKFVHQLSKGMRQRLNWAQSMLGEGDLLILDEPTNGLDPLWINRMKQELITQRNNGKTILYSTHLLASVEEIADEVIFMHQGKVIASGSVEELKTTYQKDTLELLWLKLFEEQVKL